MTEQVFKTCIYQIRNKINGRIYIGSTKNFHSRVLKHLQALRTQIHKNDYLQNAYNKYGEESFYFGILELVTVDSLLSTEQQYLDCFYDNQQQCYNMCPKANNSTGYRHSVEVKKKMSSIKRGQKYSEIAKKNMSLAHMGKKRKPETIEIFRKKMTGPNNPAFGKFGGQSLTSKKVHKYSLNGTFVDTYDSIIEASKINNTCKTSISCCCHGSLKQAGGYLWSFSREENLQPYKRAERKICQNK